MTIPAWLCRWLIPAQSVRTPHRLGEFALLLLSGASSFPLLSAVFHAPPRYRSRTTKVLLACIVAAALVLLWLLHEPRPRGRAAVLPPHRELG